ncbi:MAG: hypothetical protein KA715_09295 [Xanthomonadaceae bacterium]|nr:hypothetical protein [Xanthomonadaceae bacterium]
MKKLVILETMVCFLLLSACSHAPKRGSVIMKVGDSEAHVNLGSNELNEGDQVSIYRYSCVSPKAAETRTTVGCQKIKLGSGRVEQLLDEHYSVIKVDAGVKFSERASVEKE